MILTKKKKKKAMVKLKLKQTNHEQILRNRLGALMTKSRLAGKYGVGALDCILFILYVGSK